MSSAGYTGSSVADITADKEWAPYIGGVKQTSADDFRWQQFEDDRQLLTTEDEHHSSSEEEEDDDDVDVWAITDEQRSYYTNQFRSMQPDLMGLISGSVAKEFFEKSKLPVQELSKIWQLSDVNKDGALSLEEFFTAMHLVVLRRNNIELPDVLPQSLVPKIVRTILEDNAYNKASSPQQQHHSPTDHASPHGKEWMRFNDSPTSSVSSPGIKPVNFDFQKSAVEQDPKILHPVALRLSPEGHVLSSDEGDVNRALPVPEPIPYEPLQDQQQRSPAKTGAGDVPNDIKLGPPKTAIQRPIAKKPTAVGPGAIPPPPQQLNNPPPPLSNSHMATTPDEQLIYVDGPLHASSFSGVTTSNSAMTCPKKEPPPPPPPRPKRNHARSSSLDLNRLVTSSGISGPCSLLGAPPAVPPRMSPSTMTPKKLLTARMSDDHHGGASAAMISSQSVDRGDFADFTQFANNGPVFDDDSEFGDHRVPATRPVETDGLQTGAFEVYRRPLDTKAISGETTTITLTGNKFGGSSFAEDKTVPVHGNGTGAASVRWRQQTRDWSTGTGKLPRERKELLSTIRSHQERNRVLSHLNSELNLELSEAIEERIALEIQLEHLKPYIN